ncbi:MAG: SsrA-binding protein SmpB [Acidimicrobiales bacterium]
MAKDTSGRKVIATNRQARREFDILETIEAGIVLRGSEVKSLREAHVQFADANGWVRDGELWLLGLHIPPYANAQTHNGHEPDRERKLLLRKDEIVRLKARLDQDRLALVPTQLYFSDGRVKVELALGRGRNFADKRQALAKRDAEMETRRAMARGRRGE